MSIIKKIMAKLATRRFVPTDEERAKGAQPLDKAEIIAALQAYKKQNPTKYAAKKEALFKQYGLAEEQVPEEKPDAEDLELEEKAKKAKKVTKKQDAE